MSAPDQARPGPATLRSVLHGAMRWETGLAVLVVAIVIFGASTSGQFLTSGNIFNMEVTSGEIAIMALPMTLIIISGEIDLSVASILGMSSALLGLLWARHWPMLAIFVVVALLGLAAGLVNGLLVTRLGLPSLAVTIGTLALYRGIALIILGSNTISSFPAAYTSIGDGLRQDKDQRLKFEIAKWLLENTSLTGHTPHQSMNVNVGIQNNVAGEQVAVAFGDIGKQLADLVGGLRQQRSQGERDPHEKVGDEALPASYQLVTETEPGPGAKPNGSGPAVKVVPEGTPSEPEGE